MSAEAIENIEKMVRALELAQIVIKDMHQAVADLQAVSRQQEERLARLERSCRTTANTVGCLANGIQPE